MLKPVSSEIRIDDLEVQAAKWMALREFVEQPLIKGDNMFKKITDMCIARIGKRYCGLSVHKVVSKFENRLPSLYYNVVLIKGLVVLPMILAPLPTSQHDPN